MKKIFLALTMLFLAVSVNAAPINVPNLINNVPELNQSIVVVLDNDMDMAYLTSFTVAKWKMINFDVGYLTEDGVAVAVSSDLIETPELQFPILKYVQIKPIVGYSMNRLFSGSYKDEDNGFQIADSESWFVGATLVNIKF